MLHDIVETPLRRRLFLPICLLVLPLLVVASVAGAQTFNHPPGAFVARESNGSVRIAQADATGNAQTAPTAQAGSGPDTVCDDPNVLEETKKALKSGSGPTVALAELKREADRLLGKPPTSVMDKAKAGPSGDKHDYVSYAPYYWPNPNTANGLPYVRKDGYRNVGQVAMGDGPEYEKVLTDVHKLGLAYWYTGQEPYARQAAKLARAWFLDPATRMNPNFEYAQATLGSSEGRGTGLIENRGIVGLLDGLALLKGSAAWSSDDDDAMRQWVDQFNRWMTTSKEGIAERGAKNNHGSWYAVQEAAVLLYEHHPDQARTVLEDIKGRISKQIEPDGREPLETDRADGYSYSVFNLLALMTLADMGARHGVDLWGFDLGHRGIRTAIDYLMPFAAGQAAWPYTQRATISAGSLVPIVTRAAQATSGANYMDELSGD
jgi:hypothetical protein